DDAAENARDGEQATEPGAQAKRGFDAGMQGRVLVLLLVVGGAAAAPHDDDRDGGIDGGPELERSAEDPPASREARAHRPGAEVHPVTPGPREALVVACPHACRPRPERQLDAEEAAPPGHRRRTAGARPEEELEPRARFRRSLGLGAVARLHGDAW